MKVQGALCTELMLWWENAGMGTAITIHGARNTKTKSSPGEAQKDSQGGKDTKRNPEVLRKRKAEVKTHRSA